MSERTALAPDADRISHPYRVTPIFDAESLPAALRRAHSTKPDVWGIIRVLEGALHYRIEDDSSAAVVLTPSNPGFIQPGQLHSVAPIGAMKMRVEFYDRAPSLLP
jgi:hemoglobin